MQIKMVSKTINSTAVWAISHSVYPPTQWRKHGRGKWGHASRVAVLGSASIHFIQLFKKAVLSRNLDQKIWSYVFCSM